MFDSDFIQGECNGQNMFDCDWDDPYNEDGYSGARTSEFKWFTKDKKVLTLKEMTTEHLENALRYEFKKKNNQFTHVCQQLDDELKRRHDEGFFNQTKDCPFCAGVMEMSKFDGPIDIGWSAPKYKFTCKCGAASNYVDRTYYRSIIK